MTLDMPRRKGNNAAPRLDRVVRAVGGAAWMDAAACRGHDDLWYEPDHEARQETHEAKVARMDAARAICRDCPVRVECLETALGNVEVFGIWGGLTYSERLAVAHARPRAST